MPMESFGNQTKLADPVSSHDVIPPRSTAVVTLQEEWKGEEKRKKDS